MACTGNSETCREMAGECFDCGIRDCPFLEEMHYHHDGCPSCQGPEDNDTPERMLTQREVMMLHGAKVYLWSLQSRNAPAEKSQLERVLRVLETIFPPVTPTEPIPPSENLAF